MLKKIDFYELIDFQDIKSLLSPTSEEERAEYMEGFTPFQDEIDPIVDQWISILEGGAKVYWEDIMHDDVKVGKHFYWQRKDAMSHVMSSTQMKATVIHQLHRRLDLDSKNHTSCVSLWLMLIKK